MNPRYYPKFTAMLAVGLFAAPLAIVFLLQTSSPSLEFDDLAIDTPDIDERVPQQSLETAIAAATLPSPNSLTAPTPSAESPDADEFITFDDVEDAAKETRVAMVLETASPILSVSPDQPAIPTANSLSSTAPATSERDASQQTPLSPPPELKPTLKPSADEPASLAGPDFPPENLVLDLREPQAKASESAVATSSPESVTAPLETQPVSPPASMFSATSHLAMKRVSSPPPTEPPSSMKKSKSSRKGRSSFKKKSKEADDKPENSLGAEMKYVLSGGAAPGKPLDKTESESDPFAADPTHVIEPVVLQQPLPNRPVRKVENVIGVAQGTGWPIALVRSDLPDDYWWVQQMVGLRRNSFAARVNFGNDNSIPGSVYHMVFVFLDSPDEVRRFRIAKQFKELPEGIRRSQQFTFVRK